MSVSFATALRALLKNRLQAGLTLCGMSVGVAMVVIVSGLGLGARQKIESQIESAGPTQITIRSGNYRPAAIAVSGEQDSGGGEVSEGVMAIEGAMTDQAAASASAARYEPPPVERTRYKSPATPLGDAELRMLREDVPHLRAVAASVAGNLSLSDSASAVRVVRLSGFEPDWPGLKGWKLAGGRWISDAEHARGARVAMLTEAAARRLWPQGGSPLGRTLRLNDGPVEVVGLLQLDEDGSSVVVPSVHLPLPLARALLGRDRYDSITVRTTSVDLTTAVAQDIRERLRRLHGLPDDTLDDFRVETQSLSAMPAMGTDPRLARAAHSNVVGLEQASFEEMARSLRKAGRTFSLLLAGGAAVSLLVGGIGVMNIMLVSVAARRREIGLRMAVGARVRDVMVQFLVESIALASLGGLVGLLLGAIGLTSVKYGLHWATAVSPTMLLLALLMAAATGVAFGYGPARRAAALDPVIALRSE